MEHNEDKVRVNSSISHFYLKKEKSGYAEPKEAIQDEILSNMIVLTVTKPGV